MRFPRPIKVLVVDDSALVRSMLTRVLSNADGIEVIGGAKDPYEARELILAYHPDVIILDIEMPQMDGLTFLKKLMKHYPVPVIMCSGGTASSSRTALRAIEFGAVDVVTKPGTGSRANLCRMADELIEKIHAATAARLTTGVHPLPREAQPASLQAARIDPRRYVIAVGASTGGTEAVRRFLAHVPRDFPPILIVQHMPEGFTRSFADRLNQLSDVSVKEAEAGDRLEPGRVFLARGGIQMEVHCLSDRIEIVEGATEPVNRHCPSVDVLFDSVAELRGHRSVGVLLTGMGADGARGLLRLRQRGAITIAQDPQSCVVYGMPKAAFELGAVQHLAPPWDIARVIEKCMLENEQKPAPVRGPC